MISRIRLIITALLGCHLFLAPALLTSQLRDHFAARNNQASPLSTATDNSSTQNPGDSKPVQSSKPSASEPSSTEDEGKQVMQEVVQQQMKNRSDRTQVRHDLLPTSC